jgi:ferredoxin
MKAVRLEPSSESSNKSGTAPVVDRDRCIGCGVCAHKCPTQSIRLVPRPEKEYFPFTEREMAERMAEERGINPFGDAARR